MHRGRFDLVGYKHFNYQNTDLVRRGRNALVPTLWFQRFGSNALVISVRYAAMPTWSTTCNNETLIRRSLVLMMCAGVVTGCGTTATPVAPRAQAVSGMTRDRTSETMLKWKEGLGIMLLDQCEVHSMSGSDILANRFDAQATLRRRSGDAQATLRRRSLAGQRFQ